MGYDIIDKKKEYDFDYKNRPYKFIDAETGDVLKINPKEVRENYKESINKYTQELKLRCTQYQIDFVEADINKDFSQILIPYFHKRKKLF